MMFAERGIRAFGFFGFLLSAISCHYASIANGSANATANINDVTVHSTMETGNSNWTAGILVVNDDMCTGWNESPGS